MIALATPSPERRRGDAILAAMQAARAYRVQTRTRCHSEFDEAHAVIDRLIADGFLDLPARTDKDAA